MSSSPRSTRRRYGQNFLVNPTAVQRMVNALALSADEPVLEIGPGRGALTRFLVNQSRRVAAIEVDRRLAAELSMDERFSGLRLLIGDVLDVPCSRVAATLELGADERVVVTGNLPYNISKPIVMRLIDSVEHVCRAVLMFQREVAARLTAEPRSGDYGALTVLVGSVYRVERLFDLAPGSFRPRPKVHSTVTAWTPRSSPATRLHRERLRACLKACFHARRRTVSRNLREQCGWSEAEARERLERAEIDPASRAEAVSPEAFERLARFFPTVTR